MNREIIFDETYGPLCRHYVDRIEETLHKALRAHPRTLVLRIDLHIPDRDDISGMAIRNNVISRFMASLASQLEAQWYRKMQSGIRVHRTDLRYIWCREFDWFGNKPHYHVALLLNKDAYQSPGNYLSDDTNLATMIIAAWNRALGMRVANTPLARSLVHFPENPCYWLDVNSEEIEQTYSSLMFRLKYMAKNVTKHHEDHFRVFGCSQR
ncbi:inovirus Gp2 family protein [Dickeya zeae]|uniref:inovirus Gp2 family protein n=1 Tax=Dickeya zeae TaxID=204042 RepID=UPI0004967B93|nr:inovirus Gp2 family protein [Dickeya zeae]AJC64958.1 hypothetical protein W909_02070 [Dickeya zeae EC1]